MGNKVEVNLMVMLRCAYILKYLFWYHNLCIVIRMFSVEIIVSGGHFVHVGATKHRYVRSCAPLTCVCAHALNVRFLPVAIC